MPSDGYTSMSEVAPVDYRLLFERVPGLYLVLTQDLDIVAVTDSYLAATMTERAEILGRNIFDVFPDNPDDASATGTSNLRASLNRVVRERTVDVMAVQKYDVRRPDDGGFEVRYWSPVNSPVLAPDGHLLYVVHRVEDVTEFVRLQKLGSDQERETDELRTRAERMQAEVYQRAQQVSQVNRELQIAKEQIEKLYERTRQLDEVKTQFFANVSHELRTPLSLILGPSDRLAAMPSMPGAAAAEVEVIGRNARLLLRHVNDLLDVAKLEAGKTLVDYASVDGAALVRVSAAHFESLARERNVSFVVDADGPLPVELDPLQIDRVLVNLISNAFKFSPDGTEVRVHASCDAEQGRFRMVVEDHGPGVPPQDRVAIFERFRQLEGGVTRRAGGTGLGLAIAWDFVRLHDGTLTIEDAPGGGARFVVDLPQRAPAGTPVRRELPEVASPSVGQQLAVELRRPKLDSTPSSDVALDTDHRPLVLVVEDNPDMNRFVRESLAPDVRTLAAVNGAEGLELAIAEQPDVIVTDMMMPVMSGEALLRAVRGHDELRRTRVVLLTAKADDASRVRILRAGADDYVHKPFSAEELRARVGNLVACRRAEQAAARLYEEVAAKSELLETVGQELAAANAELEAFGHSVAHDLRAPLRSIDGFSQALVEDYAGALDVEGRGYLRRIQAAAKRMGELIDDLLMLARISRHPFDGGPVDLGGIARSVHERLARDEPRRNVEFTVEDGLFGHGDARLLTVALENLLANAWKFTRHAERAHIHVGRVPDVNGWAFYVRDDGAGFDARYAHKLFQAFQRLHSPADFEGTGIGLATVQRVVRRHGGRAWATGEVGKGATFFFTLGQHSESA